MFEKFSDSARRVLFYARYEASQGGSPHIGSEHLLLGLLKETEDVVREIFARCQVSIPEIQSRVEAQVQPAGRVSTSEELPLHESCKKVLQHALDEAKQLLHSHVGAEHLLLGLLRHEDSTGGAILQEHGVQLYEVREHVVAIHAKKVSKGGGPEQPGEAVDRACRELEGLSERQRLAVLTRVVSELEEPLDAARALDTAFETRIRREQPGLGLAEPLEQCWAAFFQRVLRLRRGRGD